MTPTLETERLLLCPLQLSDAAQTQSLFPRWEIVRFLNASVPWPYPPDGALTYYRDVALPAIARGTEWHWTLRRKTLPSLQIGAICLVDSETDHRGFWLGLPWQGQGLMTEAILAVTDFWFQTLGRSVLRTKKAAANLASIRLSEKTGMTRTSTGLQRFVAGELPAECWEITAAQWARRQDRRR